MRLGRSGINGWSWFDSILSASTCLLLLSILCYGFLLFVSPISSNRAYLGMNGKRISTPADALYVGPGTHYIPSGNLGSLKRRSWQPPCWQSEPRRLLQGLGKGAPFPLSLTKEHFSRVAYAHALMTTLYPVGVMKTKYRIAFGSYLQNDFAEGVRAILVEKIRTLSGTPSLEDVNPREAEALFVPLAPQTEELKV